MKIKTLTVLAVAALALCGLFAPGASAEETSEFAMCGPLDPAASAWYADPSRTEQEVNAAWEADKFRYCAVVEVPASQWPEAAQAMGDCVVNSIDKAHNEVAYPLTSTEIDRVEQCFAAWSHGTVAKLARKRQGARHRKHSRHRSTPSVAEIAIVR